MSRWSETYPKCRERLVDCLSYKNGTCSALRDTDFKRDCPFYCTPKMVIEKLPKELAREVFERYGKSKEFQNFYPDDRRRD